MSADSWKTRKGRVMKRRTYTATTRLWGSCPGCGCKWQWSGRSENTPSGVATIEHSACMCPSERERWGR